MSQFVGAFEPRVYKLTFPTNKRDMLASGILYGHENMTFDH